MKENISKQEFYSKLNIDPEELSYMGRGDFGEAYSTGDGRVVKMTSSKSECDIAEELVKNPKRYSGFAEVYWIGYVDGTCHIVMEELDEDSSIEDMYYQLESYLSEEGLPMQYVHMLDIDELDLDEDMIDFISGIEDINRSYRMLGIEASDIKPDNMGYDKEGNLKAFDIDDKSINESIKRIIREEIKSLMNESYEFQVRDIDGPIYYKRKCGAKIWKIVDEKEFEKGANKDNVIAWMPEMKPYSEKKISENTFIRTFTDDNPEELVWHRDREDRTIEVLENDGWMFQHDNQLPFVMKETFSIPKETFHRIIQGNGKLIIKIIKH